MTDAAQLAKSHWNETPLFLTEEERYSTYPWLYDAAEFSNHRGERILEIGCGTGSDLLQFAKHGAVATGIDLTTKHVELARRRVDGLTVVHEADARNLPFEDANFDTGRKLRRLFGPGISIEKYECQPCKFLTPWFGWFLVVKDQKT
jgi:SAM-dependent methyltransferase